MNAEPMLDALLAQAKAEALRSQAEFFRQVDMPVAADHCDEAAIGFDHQRSVELGRECDHVLGYRSESDTWYCVACGAER